MPYKLLLADDSVTIQRVIELTFADEDVKVTAVGDGQQAADHILSDRPDIVLADVGMPGKDGYEVAEFIKNDPSLAHIPVLLLTGAFEPVDEERARAVRCNGVLAKPFEPQLLISRVKELLKDAAPAPTPTPDAVAEPSRSTGGEAEQGQAEVPGDVATLTDLDAPLEVEALSLRPDPPGAPEASLDDYFDRLDAAFANLTGGQPGREVPTVRVGDSRAAGTSQIAPAWSVPPPAKPAVPPLADVFTAIDAATQSMRRSPDVFGSDAESTPASTPADDLDAASAFAAVPVPDAFAALLDAEREQGPDAVHQGSADAVATVLLPGTAVTRAFVDDVARRVMERLGDAAFRDVVAQVVSETAERLVREEIERIKASV